MFLFLLPLPGKTFLLLHYATSNRHLQQYHYHKSKAYRFQDG